MRRNLFWLSDDQWLMIEPYLRKDVRDKDRVDDRRLISGILHVIRSESRWCDCPPEYGPPTRIYNRFVRWAERGIWSGCFALLLPRGAPHGFGCKMGEQNQAIGRSRGGRNTKIHAAADVNGRLLSFLLTGGETHDCLPAQRLIRRTTAVWSTIEHTVLPQILQMSARRLGDDCRCRLSHSPWHKL
jgi:transposase